MSDNLRIWSQVDRTDPAHTKKVTQRGGFTAISAAYQIMRATEVFGPIGEGWGYMAGAPIFQEGIIFVPVTLWHGERPNIFGPMLGGAEWKDAKSGRLDSDAAKKATTDALTKLLSQLGFNADVFLGKFDDNKYVEDLEREFAPPPASNPKADYAIAQMGRCKTGDEFKDFWSKNKDGLREQLSRPEYERVVAAMQGEAKRFAPAPAEAETPFDQREAA